MHDRPTSRFFHSYPLFLFVFLLLLLILASIPVYAHDQAGSYGSVSLQDLVQSLEVSILG